MRFQFALAYHGRAVPLSWRVYAAHGLPAGTSWHDLFQQLLAETQAVLPPGRRVLVVLDRGFVSPRVWDAVRAQDWHPVLRMHIEASYRDDKSQGWQWEQSRITNLGPGGVRPGHYASRKWLPAMCRVPPKLLPSSSM